jgi:hypothetical protein
MTVAYRSVRAVYRDGMLQLLEPLPLPEGAEVRVRVDPLPRRKRANSQWIGVYPNNPQPASTLRELHRVTAVGGDALADSESLYDRD